MYRIFLPIVIALLLVDVIRTSIELFIFSNNPYYPAHLDETGSTLQGIQATVFYFLKTKTVGYSKSKRRVVERAY